MKTQKFNSGYLFSFSGLLLIAYLLWPDIDKKTPKESVLQPIIEYNNSHQDPCEDPCEFLITKAIDNGSGYEVCVYATCEFPEHTWELTQSSTTYTGSGQSYCFNIPYGSNGGDNIFIKHFILDEGLELYDSCIYFFIIDTTNCPDTLFTTTSSDSICTLFCFDFIDSAFNSQLPFVIDFGDDSPPVELYDFDTVICHDFEELGIYDVCISYWTDLGFGEYKYKTCCFTIDMTCCNTSDFTFERTYEDTSCFNPNYKIEPHCKKRVAERTLLDYG